MNHNFIPFIAETDDNFQVRTWKQTESWNFTYSASATSKTCNLRRRSSNSDSNEGQHEASGKNRKRQWHAKTRTGCLTCKARKVKCDETRPTCLRCANAHRTCEGYDVPQAQIFDLFNKPTPQSLNLIGEDVEGIQALQFFREKTTPILSIFSAYAAEFWQYVIPQISISEETIRSLVIAVGSQHKQDYEHYDEDQVPTALARLPARYYGRALRRLSDTADPPKTIVLLICCLLFIAMENVRGTKDGIYAHVAAGSRILREWKAGRIEQTSQTGTDLINNYIEPFMARLEAAAQMTGEMPVPSPEEANSASSSPTTALQWKTFVVPTSFADFTSARENWFELTQWLFTRASSFDNFFNKDLPEYQKMVALWKRWRSVLKLYEQASAGKRSVAEDWQLRLLGNHFRIHLAFLQIQAEPDEMAWDSQLEVCRKIVATCARFLDHEAEEIAKDIATGFGANPGVIPSLYSVATVCRDSELRHQCIDLMKKHHSRWHDDECTAAVMAEAPIRIEEEGMTRPYRCEDIPETRRVRPLLCTFSTLGQFVLTYSHTPYNKPESVLVKYSSRAPPNVPVMALYPLSEIVRSATFQGLIRDESPGCICRSIAGA